MFRMNLEKSVSNYLRVEIHVFKMRGPWGIHIIFFNFFGSLLSELNIPRKVKL